MIELALKRKLTGEDFLFCAQTKTSLGAGRDFLTQARRVPRGSTPSSALASAASIQVRTDQEAGAEYRRQGAVAELWTEKTSRRSVTASNFDSCRIWGLDVGSSPPAGADAHSFACTRIR